MQDRRRNLAPTRVGLVSDTHGTLDPRVATALQSVDHIVHAGDIGHPRVLWELQLVAPVTAVAGNMDRHQPLGEELPDTAYVDLAGVRIAVAHIRTDFPPEAVRESRVMVFGHSHMPLIESDNGVLWVNPGSASQSRRSSIGRSVAVLEIDRTGATKATIVALSEYGERK